LADVTVTDNDPAVAVDCGDGTNIVGALAIGASATCTASGTAELGAYSNIGSVTGTPVGPDGQPTGQDAVTDEDASHYVAQDGALALQKATNGVDADTVPGPVIAPGDPVTWTYAVMNTSDTPLVNLTLSDDQGESIDCGDGGSSIAVLLPGETFTCEATGVAGDGQYTNIGSVTGTPATPDGNGGYAPIPGAEQATAEDPSNYMGATPAIDIEKSTNGADADDAAGDDVPEILEGEPVEWTYAVTNTGDLTLIDVTVTDDQGVEVDCGNGDNTIAVLLAGETITCTGDGTAGTTPYANIGATSGTPAYEDPANPGSWLAAPDQPEVNADDPSHYNGVALTFDLALRKTRITQDSGVDQTFAIEVFNQGTTTAVNVTVVDYLPEGMVLADDDWTDNGDGTASITIAGPIEPGDSTTVEIDTHVEVNGAKRNLAGIADAQALHPVTGEALALNDIDSEPGDTSSDVVVDDVLDNTSDDEDDSDVAAFTLGDGAAGTSVTIVPGSMPRGFGGNNGGPIGPGNASAPARPSSGPLAYTGSESSRLALMGGLLIVSGAALVAGTRRRRRDDDSLNLEWQNLDN